MLQCDSAMAAALRLRLLYRMLRAGELLALVAFVSWSSSYVPSAVAAALRLAGSLLLNARFVFVLGNAIVVLLFALSRHDLSAHSSSNEQPAASSTASNTATPPAPAAPQQDSSSSLPPVAGASFASFTGATPVVATTALLPSSSVSSVGRGASFATPADPPPPPATDEYRHPAPEPDPAVVPGRSRLLFEDRHQPAAARAPRRSRSEKMRHRAASPELRRCESENGRTGRRRSSVNAEACRWGREDADEFRRQVEAFIARQTRFHREESIKTMAGHCDPAPAFTGALAVVE